MSQSPDNRQVRPRSGRLSKVLVVLAVAAGSCLVLFLAVVLFGRVYGEEFSPDKFLRRNFVYYEIPVLGVQVTRTYRTQGNHPLDAYVRKNGLVPKSDQKQPRWTIIHVWQAGSVWNGEAAILCKYLDAPNTGQQGLLRWTQKYPQLAKVVWPAIVETARQDLYIFVPDVIDIAMQATPAAGAAPNANVFSANLNDLLARKYQRLAATHSSLDDHRQAVTYYTRALQYDPQSAAARRGRAKALDALGQAEKARADRMALKQLSDR